MLSATIVINGVHSNLKDFGMCLNIQPQYFPDKFEVRFDDSFIKDVIELGLGILYIAFITDLEIMSMVNFKMSKDRDELTKQDVYIFEKIKGG